MNHERLAHAIALELHLDTPALTEAVGDALKEWRSRGCPPLSEGLSISRLAMDIEDGLVAAGEPLSGLLTPSARSAWPVSVARAVAAATGRLH